MTWAFFRRVPEHVFPRNKGIPAGTRGQARIDLGQGRERFCQASMSSASNCTEIDIGLSPHKPEAPFVPFVKNAKRSSRTRRHEPHENSKAFVSARVRDAWTRAFADVIYVAWLSDGATAESPSLLGTKIGNAAHGGAENAP